MNDFLSDNDTLLVGGVPLHMLAERAGRTPFFAYDRQKVTDRVKQLRSMLPGSVHIHYSLKANPMPALVQHLAALVNGFDVASAGEMRVALDTGMKPGKISLAGPGKSALDLRSAVASDVTVTLESRTQLNAVTKIANELGVRPKVALRINPSFDPNRSGMRMGGGPRQFGVDEEQAPALVSEISSRDVRLVGFHVFWGSQCLDADTVISAQRHVVSVVSTLAQQASAPLEFINMGGGFGIPYFEREQPLDVDAVGAAMNEWLPTLHRRIPGARPVLEFGRYLVGEAGVYVCKVVERKVSRGEVFLVTDGGLHHQLAASGNFGQVMRRNYPVVLGNKMNQAPEEPCNVVGCLCTPLDRIADKVMLPRGDIGDLVVVGQSGAYGRSASPNDFLSHPAAIEMLV